MYIYTEEKCQLSKGQDKNVFPPALSYKKYQKQGECFANVPTDLSQYFKATPYLSHKKVE